MQKNTEDSLWGHPKGLFLLFGTELWERFSYYGMRAVLVLYLVAQAENGGLGWTQESALELYGLFTGLVYLTPLFGGWLADNHLGQRRAILIGAVLMAAGQFILALPHDTFAGLTTETFYAGLGFIVIGNGLFKPNISTMVGDLYEEGDHRRDGAFTIFYMGINLGSFLAGLICGWAATKFGWQAAFICAGSGMAISFVMQALFAQRYLGDIGVVPSAHKVAHNADGTVVKLTKEEFDRIRVIIIMGLFTVIFWAGFEQAGGLMNLYAQDYTDRMLGDFEIPTAWFQSLNPFFIVTLAPLVAGLWIKLGSKEPASPVKFAFGLFLMGAGFLFMVAAAMEQESVGKASMIWLIAAYLFHTLGELCVSPIGLSMVSKLAPLRVASLMMGMWFLCNAMANYIAGLIGAYTGEAGALQVFAGIAIAEIVSGVILLLFANKLVHWMHEKEVLIVDEK